MLYKVTVTLLENGREIESWEHQDHNSLIQGSTLAVLNFVIKTHLNDNPICYKPDVKVITRIGMTKMKGYVTTSGGYHLQFETNLILEPYCNPNLVSFISAEALHTPNSGVSDIFSRRRPLSKKTLERIQKGVAKYMGKDKWTINWNPDALPNHQVTLGKIIETLQGIVNQEKKPEPCWKLRPLIRDAGRLLANITLGTATEKI